MSFDSGLRLSSAPQRSIFSSGNTGAATTAAGSTDSSDKTDTASRSRDVTLRAEKSQQSDHQAEQLLRRQVSTLASRDREVRAHEQAHASVGGRHAGGATYSFVRGPDGKSYASGGEVSIDLSAVPGNPQATLSKMEVVQRAALAPAEPSSQDLRVAAQAQVMATQARLELAALHREEAEEPSDERQLGTENEQQVEESTTPRQQDADASSLDLYRQLSGSQSSTSAVDLFV